MTLPFCMTACRLRTKIVPAFGHRLCLRRQAIASPVPFWRTDEEVRSMPGYHAPIDALFDLQRAGGQRAGNPNEITAFPGFHVPLKVARGTSAERKSGVARCGAAASPFSLMVIKSGAVLALTPMGRERSPKERQSSR